MKHLSILFFLFFLNTHLSASHILGTEMNYQCLGNQQYNISVSLYTDCAFFSPPPFPISDIFITIYKGDGSIFLHNSVDSFLTVQRTNLAAPNNYLGNPCFIPPTTTCVSLTTFDTTITLPYDTLGYQIVYQRCCLGQNITNIVNSGSSGITQYIYIPALAQTSCNSSPIFNQQAAQTLCVTDQLNMDLGATDANGDSLVYAFSPELTGADIFNPAPQIAAFSPYSPLNYDTTTYSGTQPFGVNSNISIDSQTGLVTGNPTIIGDYWVGICIKEYKDGQLIGITRRNFLYKITNCSRRIEADILEDAKINSNTYLVKSCDTIIQFINQSGQSQFITDYKWEFNFNGATLISTMTNPTVNFQNFGYHYGTLIVNSGQVCSDTAYIQVNILDKKPQANFTYNYDSMIYDPVQFINTSTGLDTSSASWYWAFDDWTYSIAKDPLHYFPDSGTYQVQLNITNSFGCSDDTIQNVRWMPLPIILQQENTIIENTSLSLSPNPANSRTYLNVKSDYNQLTFQIFNTSGIAIEPPQKLTITNDQQTIPISLENYPKGVYFIYIIINNQAKTLKLIIT